MLVVGGVIFQCGRIGDGGGKLRLHGAKVGGGGLQRVGFPAQERNQRCGAGRQFVDRRHGLALHVLRQAHGARRVVAHEQAVHLVVLRQLAALDEQLERGEAPPPGENTR